MSLSPDWSDIRLFLAAARTGSFARAARRAGVSAATIGRRIDALEQALGVRLFMRLPDGYRLTQAGHDLLPAADRMAAAFGDMVQGAATSRVGALPVFRLAAEEWEALFVARHLPFLRDRLDGSASLELGMTHIRPSLGRREVDIVLACALPHGGDLVARKLGAMAFAVYGAPTYLATEPAALTEDRYRRCRWVGFNAEHRYFPDAKWLDDRCDGVAPEQRCSNALIILEAARAGVGLAVLPCWLGDSDAGLRRAAPAIAELRRDVWWLTHPELPADRAFKTLVEALTALFRSERAALDGVA